MSNVSKYKKVQFKGDDDVFYYVIEDKGDSYKVVIDEKINHFKSTEGTPEEMYYVEFIPKSEFKSETFDDGGSLDSFDQWKNGPGYTAAITALNEKDINYLSWSDVDIYKWWLKYDEDEEFAKGGSVDEQVQELLDKKQEKKQFKDIGKRVAGSKKEKRAYSLITFSDLSDLEQDELTAHEIVTKDRVYPEVNVAEQKAAGVSSGAAFLKVELRKSCAAQPPNSKDKRASFISFIQVLTARHDNVKSVTQLRESWYGLRDLNEEQIIEYLFNPIYKTLSDEIKKTAKDRFKTAFPFYSYAKGSFIEQVISEVFGKRFSNFLFFQSDSAKEAYQKAKDLEAVTAEQEIERTARYLEIRQNAINKTKEKIKEYTDASEDQLKELTKNWSRLDPLWKKHPEEFRKFGLNYYNRKLKDDQAAFDNVPASYKERPDDWSWFEQPKDKKEGQRSGEMVINSGIPLSFIKRTGGLVIKEKYVDEARNTNLEENPITNDFGFKSVQFGNALRDKEAREHIRHFLGAISDMAEVLDIDIKAMNGIGGLSMAFAARGAGRALAHYEPGRAIINLTNKRGDGTVAHEYAHYIDNAIMIHGRERTTTSHATERTTPSIEDRIQNENVAEAVRAIVHFINKGKPGITPGVTKYFASWKIGEIRSFNKGKKSVTLDKPPRFYDEVKKEFTEVQMLDTIEDTIKDLKSKTRIARSLVTDDPIRQSQIFGFVIAHFNLDDYEVEFDAPNESAYKYYSSRMRSQYWIAIAEMFARAFECFVFDKLQSLGRMNNYLVSGSLFEKQIFTAEGGFTYVYPFGAERKYLYGLYDNLIQVIKKEYGLKSFETFTDIREDEYVAFDEQKEKGGSLEGPGWRKSEYAKGGTVDMKGKLSDYLHQLEKDEIYDEDLEMSIWRVEGYSHDLSVTQCTSSAMLIADTFGGKVYGYSLDMEDNDSEKIGSDSGGHDFAIVGDYLIDYWGRYVNGDKKLKPVLHLKEDAKEIEKYYLPQSEWEEVPHWKLEEQSEAFAKGGKVDRYSSGNDKIKATGVANKEEFVKKYRSFFSDIAEKEKIGKYLGISEHIFSDGYDTIRIFGEKGFVEIEINDFENFNKDGSYRVATNNVKFMYDNGGIVPDQTQLLNDISALPKDDYIKKLYANDPEKMLGFIQEQATGMDHPRTYAGDPAYGPIVRDYGADIVKRAIQLLSDSEKQMILASWKKRNTKVPRRLLEIIDESEFTSPHDYDVAVWIQKTENSKLELSKLMSSSYNTTEPVVIATAMQTVIKASNEYYNAFAYIRKGTEVVATVYPNEVDLEERIQMAKGGKLPDSYIEWSQVEQKLYKRLKQFFGDKHISVFKDLTLHDTTTDHVYRKELLLKKIGGNIVEVVVVYYHGQKPESVGDIVYDIKKDELTFDFSGIDHWNLKSQTEKFASGGEVNKTLGEGWFYIWVTPKNKNFKPHIWIEGGLFNSKLSATKHIKQLKETKLYEDVEVGQVSEWFNKAGNLENDSAPAVQKTFIEQQENNPEKIRTSLNDYKPSPVILAALGKPDIQKRGKDKNVHTKMDWEFMEGDTKYTITVDQNKDSFAIYSGSYGSHGDNININKWRQYDQDFAESAEEIDRYIFKQWVSIKTLQERMEKLIEQMRAKSAV